MTMQDKDVKACAKALLTMMQVGEAKSALDDKLGKKEKGAYKAGTPRHTLSSTFFAIYKTAKDEDEGRKEIDRIVVAFRSFDGMASVKETDLPSTFRQLKSDTLKALKMSDDAPEIRKTHTKWWDVKEFILGLDSGPDAIVKRIKAQLSAVKKATSAIRASSDEGKAALAAQRQKVFGNIERLLTKTEDEVAKELDKAGIAQPGSDEPIVKAGAKKKPAKKAQAKRRTKRETPAEREVA